MSEYAEQLTAELPRTPVAGAIARGMISSRFGIELTSQTLQRARLVASELANNAYQHGRGRISLRARRFDDRLRIEVADEGHGASVMISERPSALAGRGLRIVDAVAASWGVYEGTTNVWAELKL